MHREMPSVSAVPNSVHQRMTFFMRSLPASSPPAGMNKSPSANAVGTKITSDIRMASVSGMDDNSCTAPLAPASGARGGGFQTISAGRPGADEVQQQQEDPHGGDDQEQDVTADVASLHVAE